MKLASTSRAQPTALLDCHLGRQLGRLDSHFIMVQLLVSATFCWLIVLTKSSRIRLEATSTAEEHDTPRSTGWQPKLTQAPYHPRYGALSQRDLFGRQADVDVCAYINGSPDQPYTCTGTCSAYDNGYFNCCLKDSDGNVLPNCYPATSCLTPGKSNPNTASGVVVFADQTLLWYCVPAIL